MTRSRRRSPATSARSADASRWIRRCRARSCATSCPSPSVCAPHDGHALVEIGVEVSEQMDVIPEQVRVLQHHRVKYACPCCDLSLKVAPTPARIIPRGLLTEEAQAWVITGKYQFGMPLYRTAALLRRFGGDIVEQHAGRRRRAHRPGRAAGHQPAARPPAGLGPDLRRRDDGAGAQGARAQGPDQELHVGADERQRSTGAAVRLCAGSRRRARARSCMPASGAAPRS